MTMFKMPTKTCVSRLNEAMEKARIAETALQIAMGDLETMR